MPDGGNDGSQAIVITTINPPTEGVRRVAALDRWNLIVVGDRKTSDDWSCDGATFLGLDDQLAGAWELGRACPVGHYARKNLGYLHAIAGGATVVAETDDDNIPYPSFLEGATQRVVGRRVEHAGWENAYRHFTSEHIWPRGFPLERVMEAAGSPSPLGEPGEFDCPVRQHLADGDADVDAVYRLTVGRAVTFEANSIVLSAGTYCPFNSQNTVWWPPAYPLMYLPGFASFRMTDIWRSLIAQICLHAMGKSIVFGPATVFQDRNEHSLLADFEQEIPGYLQNDRIVGLLRSLPLSDSVEDAGANLRHCYTALVDSNILPPDELPLVDLWLKAMAAVIG